VVATGVTYTTSYVFSPAIAPGPHVTHYDVTATTRVTGAFRSTRDVVQTLRCTNVQTGEGKVLFHCQGSEVFEGTYNGAPMTAENTFHYTCDAQQNCTGRLRGVVTSGPYTGSTSHGSFTSVEGVTEYTIYVHAR
jgi:hypothetical protein